MSNKTLGIIVAVVGILILVLVLLVPPVAHVIGTGKKYYAAIVIGILAIIAGVIAFFSKGKKSGTGA